MAPLTHLGIIADGNRRWAKARGLPTLQGHEKGSEVIDAVVDHFLGTEVKYISFFVFSTENWSRSPEEVSYLMKLLETKLSSMAKRAQQNNIRLCICGRPERVDPKLWQRLMRIEEDTKDGTALTVCFCFNYGGHWEIVDAARRAAAAGETDWTPESFRQYLYHPEVPDCDLVVRTSGEERTSGFQLWRAAYSEFLFLDKYFPDLTTEDCTHILDEFHTRQRRFGK